MVRSSVHVGVSSGVLKDKKQLEELLWLQPEIIEFYNYPSADIPKLRSFCRQHNLFSGLHAPTPFDASTPLKYFKPTSPNVLEVKRAINLAKATVECAAEIEAKYVVVHFPSPYPILPIEVEESEIRRFFDPVCKRADELGVSVFVENMSSHPTFFLPEHYRKLFMQYPDLRLCLDFSHAQILTPATDLKDFVQHLGPFIGSCHVNNSNLLRYGRYGAELVGSEQLKQDGYADVCSVVREIIANIKNKEVYFIHEVSHPINRDQHSSNIQWFRRCVRDGCYSV